MHDKCWFTVDRVPKCLNICLYKKQSWAYMGKDRYKHSDRDKLQKKKCFRSFPKHMWNLLKIVVKSSQFIHLFDISDLIPLDLLSFVLEKDPSKLAPNVHVKQARGVSGVHFSGPHTSMTFPSSSQLLVNCELFPQNISIVLTLKIDSGAAKVSILEVRLHVKFTVRSPLNPDPGSSLRLWVGFRALTGNKSVNQYGIST